MATDARSGTTLTDYLRSEWLPAIRPTVRHTTYFNYVTHVECHFVPWLGEKVLAQLDGRTINRFYSILLSQGRRDGRGGLAASTVRRVHAALHKALKDAVRWGYLDSNPVDAADPPTVRAEGPHEMSTWTPTQLRRFLEFIRADRFYPLLFVLATTGMRRGEVLGLRWCDVDLEAGHLAVRTSSWPGVRCMFRRPRPAEAVGWSRSTVERMRSSKRIEPGCRTPPLRIPYSAVVSRERSVHRR